MNIGIVGAEEAKFTQKGYEQAVVIIGNLLTDRINDKLVSGHCHLGGIDIWAENWADGIGMEKIIFPPKHLDWISGYKPRNLRIAKASDIVHCIAVDVLPTDYTGMRFDWCYHCRTRDHVKSGGCWTMLKCKVWKLHIVQNY